MVEGFGYGGKRLGVYAGMMAATFCAAQLCSSLGWGLFSDAYGRKPAIIIGTFGAGFGMLVFGLSTTYTQAIIGRALSGFLSGNLGVVKCFLTEITNESNRGMAFSYMSLGSSIGTVVGPLVGGLLCKPVVKYPAYFHPHSIFDTCPYLLPCLICVMLNVISALLCVVYMVESRIWNTNTNTISTTTSSYSPNQKEVELTSMRSQVYTAVEQGEDDKEGLELVESPVSVVAVDDNVSNNQSQGLLVDDRSNHGSAHPEEEEEEEEEVDCSCGLKSYWAFTSGNAYQDLSTSEAHRDNRSGMNTPQDESESDCNSVISVSDLNELSSQSSYDIEACITEDAIIDGEESRAITTTKYHVRHKKIPVLKQKTVVMITGNYGLLAMAAILLDETIPLMLKLSVEEGGFEFTSSQIGILLSCSGAFMIGFTMTTLPSMTRLSKRLLNGIGTLGCIPVCLLWPIIATINHYYVTKHQVFHALWPCLIITYIFKATLSTIAFTGVLMQVNHSVYYEDLGKVNGLGQSFASLARTLGPALGGCLWSFSIHKHFVFLNFIIVSVLYLCSDRLNAALPPRLDYQKVHKNQREHSTTASAGTTNDTSSMMH